MQTDSTKIDEDSQGTPINKMAFPSQRLRCTKQKAVALAHTCCRSSVCCLSVSPQHCSKNSSRSSFVPQSSEELRPNMALQIAAPSTWNALTGRITGTQTTAPEMFTEPNLRQRRWQSAACRARSEDCESCCLQHAARAQLESKKHELCHLSRCKMTPFTASKDFK